MSIRLLPQIRTVILPRAAWKPTPCFASSSRLLSSSTVRRNLASELEKQLAPREIVERKRKEMEAKYGDKLKKKVASEGVESLDELKVKVMVPSVKSALQAKTRAEEYRREKERAVEDASKEYSEVVDRNGQARPALTLEERKARARVAEEENRSGVKPLSSIINLPLLQLTPHTSEQVSQIWNTYHISHSTLSKSFLSASLPATTYKSMLALAQLNPFFILPLPRESPAVAEETDGDSPGTVKTDEYDMYYLQWIFHPSTPSDPYPSSSSSPIPRGTSAILTPLEEFKKNGEWAEPYLVFTHYPDLANSHNLVLMRGEITAASAGGPPGSMSNPGWMLSQQQAQLLAVAMQRFYCADVVPPLETPQAAKDRQARKEALTLLREKPEEWDWSKLVGMVYGGML